MNYILDEIPRGQLNNVILTTMLDGDKYGYEIIDEILYWSDGKIEIKQPSLYSALTRLEKAEMLTSYWTDSDIGGRRHYYRLTDLGRKTATGWAENFMQTSDAERHYKRKSFEELTNQNAKEEKIEEPKTQINETAKVEEKETTSQETSQDKNSDFTILDQGNMFQLINNKETKIEESKQKVISDDKLDELQYNLFDKIPVQEEVKETKIHRAARIANLHTKTQLVQLKQYTEMDRKNEFESLKQNRNSYFETPSSNIVSEEKNYSYITNDQQTNSNVFSNIQQSSSEDIKPQLSEASKPLFVENTKSQFNFEKKEENKVEDTFNISKYSSQRDGYFLEPEKVEEKNEIADVIEETKQVEDISTKTDGIFLNEYESAPEPPKVKKIEPFNLNIELPNQNESISFRKRYELNAVDKINNLYSQTENRIEARIEQPKQELPKQEVQMQQSKPQQIKSERPSFSSYMSLKNYYSHLGIKFNEYKKFEKDNRVNKSEIWLMNVVRCSFLLIASVILSLILNFAITADLYGRIAFIIIPFVILAVMLGYGIMYFDAKRNPKTKLPVLNVTSNLYSSITAVCSMVLVIAINLILGFNASSGIYFLPTLIYPIVLLAEIIFIPQLNLAAQKIVNKLKKD